MLDELTWSKRRCYSNHVCKRIGWLLTADRREEDRKLVNEKEVSDAPFIDARTLAKAQLQDCKHRVVLGLPYLVVEVSQDDWNSFPCEDWVMIGTFSKIAGGEGDAGM